MSRPSNRNAIACLTRQRAAEGFARDAAPHTDDHDQAAATDRAGDTASKMVMTARKSSSMATRTSPTRAQTSCRHYRVRRIAALSGGEIHARPGQQAIRRHPAQRRTGASRLSLDTLSPDVIERIEILHAASAEYSTQSIAGTISVAGEKPSDGAAHFGWACRQRHGFASVNLQLSDHDSNFCTRMARLAVADADNPGLELGYA